MTDPDIVQKLMSLRDKWYWAHREAAETIQLAIMEINYLRQTARLPDSILDNPHAGVSGWGKGKDE